MGHVKPRLTSSHPSVHFSAHPTISPPEKVETKEEKGLIMGDWILPHGMERVHPTPLAEPVTTTTTSEVPTLATLASEKAPKKADVPNTQDISVENKTDLK